MKKITSVILALLVLAAALCGCAEKEIDRTKSAIYTENYEITTGMLTYYFNAQYLGFVNAYGENLESAGLDTSLPLSEQECSLNGTNWYDYFMDAAKSKLTQCLIISEQASLDGKALSKAERKEVNEVEKSVKEDAKENKLSTEAYIEKTFGKGVTLDDIIKCTEMEKLATKYYADFKKTLDTDEKAMQEYYDGHKKTYSTVDYMLFSIPITGADQLEINDAYKVALDLGEAKTPEEFKKGAKAYLSEYYQNASPDLSSDEVSEKAENDLKSITFNDAPYSSSSSAARWAFDDERTAGDTTVIKNDQQSTYDVYYLLTPPTREEYRISTIRQILIDPADYDNKKDAKSEADKLLKELKESGFSEQSFKRLCAEYSADTDTATSGGLYENLSKGSLKNADEIESWLFDTERVTGDSAVIYTKEYGYHIVYLEAQGDPIWLEQSRHGFLNSRFEDYIEELSDNFMVYENNNIIYKITEVSLEETQA